jgi:AP-2 complex subunit mu-1
LFSRGVADVFRMQVIMAQEVRSPVRQMGTTSFFHIKAGNCYVVAVSKQNINVGLVFEVLHKMVGVYKSYFGSFDEESIKNNFVMIYELLDEILDYGYPQNFSPDVLKMFIGQDGSHADKLKKERIDKITVQATGAIPWRGQDIKHRKNEIYIDAVESVNLLMSDKGNVLRADVSGQIMMKCFLSGMPECKFGLNDKLLLDREAKPGAPRPRKANGIEIDDCTFHQCVRLGKFDSDRTISFIPPDGEFELMKYRTTENVNMPFRIIPIVKEIGSSRVEYRVSIKSNFHGDMFGSSILGTLKC